LEIDVKCPSCKRKLSIKDEVQEGHARSGYECADCNKKFFFKYSFAFIFIFFLLGAPIIEIIIRLSTEPVIHMLFGDLELYGWEVGRVASIIITLIIMIFIFFKLNVLVEASKEEE